ncbi:MAG: tRNA (adenosine(37)-N6)-dimethylallyltransferase MiaA [Thermodesulfobacteriota bacterium]
MDFNLLVILGPTASGKTKVGVKVAQALNGEIISADSRQVYRGMDIGTGKDLKEYGSVPYHLIDIVDPGYEFSVFEFQRLFFKTFTEIQKRGHLPILVGGTGLYIDSVLRAYQMVEVPLNPALRQELSSLSNEELAERLKKVNPKLHNTTDLLDRERLLRAIEISELGQNKNGPSFPEIRPLVFGIRWPREILKQRINLRLTERLRQGMVEEVERLQQKGISLERLESYGLEYRFIAKYLKGELTFDEMEEKLRHAIHQFTKRQMTWFRRMERMGINIHWVDGGADPAQAILQIIENRRN